MSYCIYLRKSRADAEAELRGEGETLARHEKALISFAKSARLEIGAIYREIVSGETIAARPEMQRLLAEVGNGLWDGVIVMDIDRLARGNSIDQGIISQTFLFSGTKILTPAKTYDPQNEFDEEYFEFGLFMSRREYKTINRRLQRGRIASVKEGKYVSNKAPYGYEREKLKNDKGFTLRVVPEKAAVIQDIFSWYTDGLPGENGTKKRIGVSLIARELNRRGLTSATGGVWTSQTIRDILINPVYIGKIRWNWRPTKKKMENGIVREERPRCSDYILHDGLHEAIISEDTFAEAQKLMSRNKSRPVRGDKKTSNPLAGLVICALCGRKMQRRPNPSTADLLMCPEPTCDNHASFLHLVETRTLDSLSDWVGKLNIKSNAKNNQPQDDEPAELKTLLNAITAARKQLDRAFEAFETGLYDAETFRERSSVLKERISGLQTKYDSLRSATDKIKNARDSMKYLIPRTLEVISAYSGLPDAAEKNKALSEIIDHIDYVKYTRGHGHENDFEIIVYPMLHH